MLPSVNVLGYFRIATFSSLADRLGAVCQVLVAVCHEIEASVQRFQIQG
jgi:hypothetical protein